MSVYILALGIKAANGLVKSTINTANAFADEGTEVSIINILGKNGGLDFLDPAFSLNEKVSKYSLDALSQYYPSELQSTEFHTENQQFLKASFHYGHKQVLEDFNQKLTENDLIIFSHPLAMVLFAKANPKTKAKTLIQVHGNYIEEVDNLNLLKDYVDYVDFIQTVSMYMKDDLSSILELPINNEKIICIYNITRPLLLSKKKSKYTKRISIVGSIQRRKNQLDAIKMLHCIEDRNVVLQIYGKALKQDYIDFLNSYINIYNLKDRVIFKGLSSEKEIYENSDIIIMTSEHEGYPYIFMESSSYNIPIVSYDFKYGAKEFTCNNKNGCLIPMFDYEKMAEVVENLLNNENEYQKVVNFNKRHFNEEYAEDLILKSYHKIFKNVNQKINLLELPKKVTQEIVFNDLNCSSNQVETKEFWSNKTIKSEVFRVTFNASLEKDKIKFFYVYKKSKFPISNVYFNEKENNEIKFNFIKKQRKEKIYSVYLDIPKKNRLTINNEDVNNLVIYAQLDSGVYKITEIVDGKLKQESNTQPITKENVIFGNKKIKDVPHILKPNGFYIRYPSFEAIRCIKNEEGEILSFSTHVLRFYGKDLLFFKLNLGLYKKLNIEMNSGGILSIDFSEYSYKSVFDKMVMLEEKYNFFDIQIANIYVWELIRVAIFEHILEATGVLDQHFSKPNPIQNVYFGQKSLENIPKADRLIFEFPRKGKIDYRTLAIQRQFMDSCVILDYPQRNGYSDNVYNDHSQHYPIKDFLDYCSKDNTKIEYSSTDKQIIRWLKSVFINEFSLDIEFSLFVNARIIKFLREFNYFNEHFASHKYKEIFIPSAYWSAGIIAAAKSNRIITSDIQYALISRYHPSFAFYTPARAYGTDRVYLWSKYWNLRETTYNKSFVSESNYFKEKISALNIQIPNLDHKYDVAFVSQGRIGRRIFNFALEFAKENPKLKIAFCPHPDELIDEYPRYSELSKLENINIISGYETLYIMSLSRYVVGVYSTSLIEALALGKEVFSIVTGGHEVMIRENDRKYIEYVETTLQLKSKIAQKTSKSEDINFANLLFNM